MNFNTAESAGASVKRIIFLKRRRNLETHRKPAANGGEHPKYLKFGGFGGAAEPPGGERRPNSAFKKPAAGGEPPAAGGLAAPPTALIKTLYKNSSHIL